MEFYAGSGAGFGNGSIKFYDGVGATILKIFDGDVYFGTYTGVILPTAGYITIRDALGTLRRLLVG